MKKIYILLLLIIFSTACASTVEEEDLIVQHPMPSGDLILGSSLDSCDRVNSEPYNLDAYFENHPYNQNIYNYYVYRIEDFLDLPYFYGTSTNAVASLKLPTELDPGDEIRIDWINEAWRIVDTDEGFEDLEEYDEVVKTHRVKAPLPCEDGETYIGSEFNLADYELPGPFANFRVDFSYNDNLEYTERFSLDGVQ